MPDWPSENDIPESLSGITGMGTFVTWADDKFERAKNAGVYDQDSLKPAVLVLGRDTADRNGILSQYVNLWSPHIVPEGQKVWSTSAFNDYFDKPGAVTPFFAIIKPVTTEKGKQYFKINTLSCSTETLSRLPQICKDLIGKK